MQISTSESFIQQEVPGLLEQLSEQSTGRWGIMGPQHMVEHLSVLFYISSKDIGMKYDPMVSEQGIDKEWLLSDAPFPRMIRGVGLKEGETQPLRFKDLEEAKQRFLKGMNGFFSYFQANEGGALVHPAFGELNYEEWVHFHDKHIRHHFAQFGLLEE